jgi:hypothetical protein
VEEEEEVVVVVVVVAVVVVVDDDDVVAVGVEVDMLDDVIVVSPRCVLCMC